MILNSKRTVPVMIIFCFIAVLSAAQSPDTLKIATVQEKSEAITLRIERELSLTKAQSNQLMKVLTERFQSLEQTGLSDATLESATRKVLQKIKAFLNNDQYVLYEELRIMKIQDKDKYLKDHPGFEFSKEDIEMDF